MILTHDHSLTQKVWDVVRLQSGGFYVNKESYTAVALLSVYSGSLRPNSNYGTEPSKIKYTMLF